MFTLIEDRVDEYAVLRAGDGGWHAVRPQQHAPQGQDPLRLLSFRLKVELKFCFYRIDD